MINMKHILYTISLLVLLGACTDEAFNDEPSAAGGKPGKPVPVNLSLNLQPLQSPLDAATKAGSRMVSSTEVCKGMEISLVKTPVALETRAADMDEVKNFWVVQFDGTDPETSKLAGIKFYPDNSVKTVALVTSTVKNRIIVIANADENTFSELEKFVSPQGNYLLKTFNDLGIVKGDKNPDFPLFTFTGESGSGSGARPVLSGSADIIVTDNAQADIMLYRSTAEVTVTLNIKNSIKEKYDNWTYQFVNVPSKSYYHAIGREPAFPGDAPGVSYDADKVPASMELPKPPPGKLYSTVIMKNLPVNLHHGVPFTTPEKRVTNAPFNSTFLQIMGADKAPGGVITSSVVYQIHLGSNFTDDYSVSPNYQYTYDITITGENDDDSRVIKFIPGYFGGALQKYDQSGTPNATDDNTVCWKYEKRIEVYISDVGENGGWLASSQTIPSVANDLMDGRQNTANLFNDKEKYPAIKKCIDLNGEGVTATNLEWYTPSFGQALGIYVSGSNTLKTLKDVTYWTSSFNPIAPTDNEKKATVWGTKIQTGRSVRENPEGRYYLRCVKDLALGNSGK